MFKENKSLKTSFVVAVIFTALALVNLVLFIVLSSLGIAPVRNISYVFAIGIFGLVWLPFILQLIFKSLHFNAALLLCWDVFMFCSVLLGSLWGLYDLGFGFDKIIHFASGILFGILGWNLLLSSKKCKLSLFWLFVFVAFFATALGAIWEIYEFSSDILIGNDAQNTSGFFERAAIMDTMLDIIMDFCGSLIAATAVVLFTWKKSKTETKEVSGGEKQNTKTKISHTK